MKRLRSQALPPVMSALVTSGRGVALVERPVPVPAKDQVLVRMRAAPINPNDLMLLDGTYDVKKPEGRRRCCSPTR